MQQFLKINVKAPADAEVQIKEVYQVDGKLIAVAQLYRNNGFGFNPQGTKNISDTKDVETNSEQELEVDYYLVVGKSILKNSLVRKSPDYFAIDSKTEIKKPLIKNLLENAEEIEKSAVKEEEQYVRSGPRQGY